MVEEISKAELEEMEEMGLKPAAPPKPKKKKRKSEEDEEPAELHQLSGSEVIRILDFLHRRYLSWMTEAESAKYSQLYRTAREEALKETLETYAELQKQNQALLERMEKLINALEGKLVAQAAPPQPPPQQQLRSLLDDPRVRALLFVAFDYFASKNPELSKYRQLIQALLLPETLEQREQAETTS
jgi:hypothetical protein